MPVYREKLNGWLTSQGHCTNIINPDYTEMGEGKLGIIGLRILENPKNKKTTPSVNRSGLNLFV